MKKIQLALLVTLAGAWASNEIQLNYTASGTIERCRTGRGDHADETTYENWSRASTHGPETIQYQAKKGLEVIEGRLSSLGSQVYTSSSTASAAQSAIAGLKQENIALTTKLRAFEAEVAALKAKDVERDRKDAQRDREMDDLRAMVEAIKGKPRPASPRGRPQGTA